MKKDELKKFEKLLLAAREALDSGLRHIEENNLNVSQRDRSGDLSGYSFHMADVGTDNFERETQLNIASSETDRLRMVEEALERIKDKTYGKCLTCSKNIKIARLKAMPYAKLCISCQEEEEKSLQGGT